MADSNTVHGTQTIAPRQQITVEEAAALLKVQVRQVRAYVAQGKLAPVARSGARHLFDREDVALLLRKNRRRVRLSARASGDAISGPGSNPQPDDVASAATDRPADALAYAAENPAQDPGGRGGRVQFTARDRGDIQALLAAVAKLKARLDVYERVIDLPRMGLRYSDAQYVELYARVRATTTNLTTWRTPVAQDWARVLLLVDEEDMVAMWRVCERAPVWVDMLRLTRRFLAVYLRNPPRLRGDPDGEEARQYLLEAERRMRTSIHLLYTIYGREIGVQASGVLSISDDILGKITRALPRADGQLPPKG